MRVDYQTRNGEIKTIVGIKQIYLFNDDWVLVPRDENAERTYLDIRDFEIFRAEEE